MLNAENTDELISEYLSECYTEPTTDIYAFVEDKYNKLIDYHGYKKIEAAIEVCLPHQISVEDEQWRKVAKKFTKQEVMEINTTVGFLCGIAEAELRRAREVREE